MVSGPKANFRIGPELWARFGAALAGRGEPLRVVVTVPRNGSRSGALVAFAQAAVEAAQQQGDPASALAELAEVCAMAAAALRVNAPEDGDPS